MVIGSAEQAAIKAVVAAGAAHGYGNMISHLASAWANSLMTKYGMDEDSAIMATCERNYPIAMHLDLMERGMWDETGRRYLKETPHAP